MRLKRQTRERQTPASPIGPLLLLLLMLRDYSSPVAVVVVAAVEVSAVMVSVVVEEILSDEMQPDYKRSKQLYWLHTRDSEAQY